MSKTLITLMARIAWVLFVWVLLAGLAKAQPRAFFGSGKHGNLTLNSSAAVLNTDDTRAAVTGISNVGSRMLLTLDGAHFYGTFDTSDWVIVIEMEGDSVGNYVYAQVDSMSGTSLYTRTTFTRVAYSTGERIQVIKVSEYYDLRIFGGVMTCHPYDGFTGGILAVFVQNDFELNYDGLIDLVNKGYPGALGGNGGAGASPAGSFGTGGSPYGGNGNNASGSSPGFNGITGWAVCTNDVTRSVMLGGRGGVGTNQVAATAIPGAGSDAIQYPFSDFIQKRLVMGRGGNGGDGGMGANAGGNGGGGGAGLSNGVDGQLGGPGEPGGRGGNGGTGGGAMYLRAYNVEAKTKPSLGTGLLEARIIGYGSLGQNGGVGGRGGEAGRGGDGGQGGCDGSFTTAYGPGGGGAPGIRGNGGDGGQGGQTGMGATAWIVYGNDYNTFEPYWQVNNSNVSSPGLGGDIATNPGAYGERPVFDINALCNNLFDVTALNGYKYCSVGTVVTERCDGWEAFCRFGKMDSLVVLTGNRYQFYLKSDTSSKCFYQKSTHTLQCTTKFVYPDAPTHPGYTWYDIAECKLEPNSSCDSLMQRLIDSAGKPGVFGQCDTFPYNVRFRDSIIFYSGTGFIDSLVRGAAPQFVCYNLLCESDSVDLGCLVSECVRIGNPGPVADAGIAGIVVRQQELPSGKKATNVLEETEDKVGIRLYPNPTNGKLFLQFEVEVPQGDYEVSLYDISGRMVKTERLNLTAVSRNFTLRYEESQLKGTYFVVISGQGRTTTKKILFDN